MGRGADGGDVMDWRSIETDEPPHDVSVLLYTPPIERTVTREEARYEVRPYSHGRPGARSFHAYATHWMPLVPPKEIP